MIIKQQESLIQLPVYPAGKLQHELVELLVLNPLWYHLQLITAKNQCTCIVSIETNNSRVIAYVCLCDHKHVGVVLSGTGYIPWWWWRSWCGRREHLRELDGVLGAADGVVEAEVAAVGGGGLVGGDVRVGQEVDVDGDEDAGVVHVGGALEVGVRGGEPGAGEQAGVDGHHVDATVHGQRPRRLLRERLGQGVPQLQERREGDKVRSSVHCGLVFFSLKKSVNNTFCHAAKR